MKLGILVLREVSEARTLVRKPQQHDPTLNAIILISGLHPYENDGVTSSEHNESVGRGIYRYYTCSG